MHNRSSDHGSSPGAPAFFSRRVFVTGAAALGVAAVAMPRLFAAHPLAAATRPASWTMTALDGSPWVGNHGLDAATYQAEFDRLAAEGYRLINISGYSVSGVDYYASIWTQAPGPAWVGMHGLSSDDYQAQFDSLTAQGFRPVDISGYDVGGAARYAALFDQSTVPAWAARHGIAEADYQADFDTNVANGLRPLRVSGYNVAGSVLYAAIWVADDGTPWSAFHGLDNAGAQAEFDRRTAEGLRLVDVSGFEANGTDHYTAIYDASPVAFWITHPNMTGDAYQAAFNENTASGYRLSRIAGYGVAGEARYTAIWTSSTQPVGGTAGRTEVDKFATDALAAANVPGVSVAIAMNGRLVYAKGYGTADRSTGEAMTVEHRLRIASISKPITAAAIVRLAEAGTLALDDFVFGDTGWLGNGYGTNPYPENMYDITINHLLQHTSGGWGGASDTMFQQTDMNHDELITWTLDNFPPTDTPGTVHAYSNFGYCLLGRIIEAAVGQGYEQYVRNTLLADCGITEMQIAGDTLDERASDEAVYDGTNSTYGDPYGIPVHRMDSHGGWIATATDLLRFMVRMDAMADPADVVTNASLTTMTAGSTANAGYGQGWALNGNNWFHTGRLGGTESILVRHDSGIAYAVIANGNGLDPDSLGRNMAYAVADWGEGTAL